MDPLTAKLHPYLMYYLLTLKPKEVFDVLSSCRKPDLVDARQMAMLLMRERGMSLKNIGRFMNRDHSTVIYDVNTVWSRIEVYPHFQTLYDELSQTLCALN